MSCERGVARYAPSIIRLVKCIVVTFSEVLHEVSYFRYAQLKLAVGWALIQLQVNFDPVYSYRKIGRGWALFHKTMVNITV